MHSEYPFQITYIVLWFIAWSVRMYYMGFAAGASPEKIGFKAEGVFAYLRILIGIPALIILIAFAVYPPWVACLQIDLNPDIRWLGFSFGVLATALYIWVHRHLAHNFTGTVHVRTKGKLVDTGPYAYVRHPMYYAFGLGSIAIYFLTAIPLLGAVGMFAILMLALQRTPIEEKKLREVYGKEYEDYCERVGRWVPKF